MTDQDRPLLAVNYLWSIIYSRNRLAKAKVSVTIDSGFAKEIDAYLRKLVVEAAKSGKPIPKQSHVYEEIVRRGWEAMRKEKERK